MWVCRWVGSTAVKTAETSVGSWVELRVALKAAMTVDASLDDSTAAPRAARKALSLAVAKDGRSVVMRVWTKAGTMAFPRAAN